MQHAIHLRLLQRMLFRLEPGSWLQHRKGLCRDAVCPIMGTNLIQRRRPNAVPHVRHTAGPEIIFLIAALHQLQHINLVGCAGKIGEKQRAAILGQNQRTVLRPTFCGIVQPRQGRGIDTVADSAGTIIPEGPDASSIIQGIQEVTLGTFVVGTHAAGGNRNKLTCTGVLVQNAG